MDQVYELFLDLGADEHQIEFPIVYTNARAGTATLDLETPGTDLRPLLDLLVAHTPPQTYEPGHPLQQLVTNLAANDYVGRMAVGRIRNGTIRMGQRISVVRAEEESPDGSIEPGRTVTLAGAVTSLTTARGPTKVDRCQGECVPYPSSSGFVLGSPVAHRFKTTRSTSPAAARIWPARFTSISRSGRRKMTT